MCWLAKQRRRKRLQSLTLSPAGGAQRNAELMFRETNGKECLKKCEKHRLPGGLIKAGTTMSFSVVLGGNSSSMEENILIQPSHLAHRKVVILSPLLSPCFLLPFPAQFTGSPFLVKVKPQIIGVIASPVTSSHGRLSSRKMLSHFQQPSSQVGDAAQLKRCM